MLTLVCGQATAVTISNTARVDFLDGPTPRTTSSNTVTLDTVPPPSPAVVEFLRYAPGSPGSVPTPADGGSCRDGAGVFSPMPAVTDSTGAVIDTTAAPILDAVSFQLGEAVFIRLSDTNRNLDPLTREFIDLRITSSTGDEEVLRLRETGIDTGVFAAAIQNVATPPAANRFDCRFSVTQGATLQADYVDELFPADTAVDSAVVESSGFVFDSSTGLPIDGATITLIDVATGQPATVFGIDGTSSYPATVTSGAAVTDSSGRIYTQPPGGFQFPSVAPGNYILLVTPPAGFSAPSIVPLAVLQALRDPAGNPYVLGQGSFGDAFNRPATPGFRIDIPVDPIQSGLLLQKSASTTEISAGEFLQYRLTLRNLNIAGAVADVSIDDTLPAGMRYQPGSLRIAGQSVPDPAVSADGRTLTIFVGILGAGAQIEITYLVQVGAGARAGNAVNRATAVGGGVVSNPAQAVVRIREPFFSAQFTIIGRVVEGDCKTPWQELDGVPGVRMLLDDGTYVPTDRDGQFHFEGVRPGTHVVQLDLDSLPPDLEAIPCEQNSRFAGRSFSQFVEAQGGSLWRTDFRLRRREAQVGLRLHSAFSHENADGRLSFRVELDGGRVAVANLVATVQLPEGVSYSPGSTRVDGAGAADPEIADGFAMFRLGDVGADWRRAVEFEGRAPRVAVGGGVREYTLRAQFDSGRASLRPEGAVAVEKLVAQLRGTSVQRIAVVGHTDSQAIRADRLKIYRDNHALSRARAETVAQALADGLGLPAERIGTDGKGPDEPVAGNDTPAAMAQNRRVEVIVFSEEAATSTRMACAADGFVSRAVANFATQGQQAVRTPMVENRLPCGDAIERGDDASRRETITVTGAGALRAADVAYERAQAKRRAIADDPEAAGANIDWLNDQAAGTAWLFPGPDHNPRAPTQRVAIKHAPGQTVVLKYRGERVNPLAFDGVQTNAMRTVSVSVWRGLPLADGENRFDAEVQDERGAIVQTLTRNVHYANRATAAVLVPEESVLVADGLQKPVIAVRLLDRSGHPVRAGVSGAFRVDPPHVAAERVAAEQQRQLAGLDREAPTYRIEGDDGVAYIELAPTNQSGSVVLRFGFPQDGREVREQELRVWLAATPRDWVIVGFAAGTVGYNTLRGNMQSFTEAGGEEDGYRDGQLSLYAKGRVLGGWLLTLAYDSDKPGEARRRENLLSTIDPHEFYTLYGDGTEQRYDGASAEKLYLKLERDQFYALIGDYETGHTQTQLSRYSRTLTGLKGEYHGDVVDVTGFASDTAQNFARDEIQGNGTSGLYRLSRGGIVINGERIRIETRDRYRSELILSSRQLLRHLDYDIDYGAGTLLFRELVNIRDFDFNPVFIVAEYETVGTAGEELNAGGRIGARLLGGRLDVGASLIRDEALSGSSDLGGVDARFRLTPGTELRLEGAASDTQNGTLDRDGSAYLAELQHRSDKLAATVYIRRQSPGFGLSQQNAAESGTKKTGLDAQWRLGEHLAVQGQTYRQDNLASGASRDAASAAFEYRADLWSAKVGAQVVQDEAGSAQADSRQLTAGASRRFFDQKLELTAQGDFSLRGDNDSVDFPSRYQLGAAWAVNDDLRLIAAHEIADGDAFDSSTSRLGVEVIPWKGARLTNTLNQSDMSENSSRTFALMGLSQSFRVGKRWSFDVSTDASRSFDEASQPLVINENHPFASGGVLGNGALTEDFFSFSGGATYRSEYWSWTGRAETRNGETSERDGLYAGFLRQAQAGIAFAASLQAFQVEQADASQGRLADLSLSWAYRPLGRQWSVLERLEFRHDELNGGTGLAGGGLFGANSLSVSGDAKARRLVNNLVVNHVARAWDVEDTRGNLFDLGQRSQWSLYYGSKYVFDRFDGLDYSGYTDLLGFEWRHDLSRRIDVGLRGSLLHAWNTDNYDYSVGPVIGWSPIDNAWISFGYNLQGFSDRDFEAAHYTAQGPFLTLRFKFDQATRLRADDFRGTVTP
ncbi:MAG: OmpA family protein [Gammaproteobacteria bacterium]